MIYHLLQYKFYKNVWKRKHWYKFLSCCYTRVVIIQVFTWPRHYISPNSTQHPTKKLVSPIFPNQDSAPTSQQIRITFDGTMYWGEHQNANKTISRFKKGAAGSRSRLYYTVNKVTTNRLSTNLKNKQLMEKLINNISNETTTINKCNHC